MLLCCCIELHSSFIRSEDVIAGTVVPPEPLESEAGKQNDDLKALPEKQSAKPTRRKRADTVPAAAAEPAESKSPKELTEYMKNRPRRSLMPFSTFKNCCQTLNGR